MEVTPCGNIVHTLKNRLSVPGLIRKLLIAWLLAVTVEYLFLDPPLRDLTGLKGIAEMSAFRMALVAAAAGAAL